MIPKNKFLPGIAWFFLVLVLICIPGSQFPKGNNWIDKFFVDKWVHAVLFGTLAYLIMLPIAKSALNKKSKLHFFIKISLAVSIWGLATEYIQKYFIPFRSFDWWDWAADALGALAAYVIIKKNTEE
ncbi:MAG: VanZ family protein [Ferruginibacter sp.]